jgi:hypothetical protein
LHEKIKWYRVNGSINKGESNDEKKTDGCTLSYRATAYRYSMYE